MAASTARAFLVYPATHPSLRPYHHHQLLQRLQPPPQPPPPSSADLHLLIRPWLPSILPCKRRGFSSASSSAVSCLISGVDGGGVSDDFVSTRKSGFSREFSVIANMLKRIEPLDASVISKGVSDSAKDSMKQTISTMLGLLPSDQFSVTVWFPKRPLDRLIVSSIITGYTLWNAEYRISLMRNFDITLDISKDYQHLEENGVSELKGKQSERAEGIARVDGCAEVLDRKQGDSLGNLSPEVVEYIQQLESELSSVKQELHTRKQENLQMEYVKRSNNDLLEYLRSLDSDMVAELSRPSSWEVEDFIHQLAQNILQRFFKDEITSNAGEDFSLASIENYDNGNECSDTIGTSRDYLAKLLFWCMLLGHHLRGLENRLHLSCAVGLL
ncbi:uncharacterized protein LOC113752903 [Coffea eugenioides]|uniref:Uncharacterized protein n=1 Tax=Coffea arabica TaxID=13443 RepID=A0ABM4V6F3_COFAR|nr:uncharacterized protein LOC113752903 [Coffea eugenioides]